MTASAFDQPSRTGQAVAAYRATLTRPHFPGGDPDAQAQLCAGMRPVQSPSLRSHLAVRTRFVDDQVRAARADRIGQVVILGAGYDDRALRFPAGGLRYFEVDHVGTQADKAARLARLGIDPGAVTLVAADFRTDDVDAALGAAGHDTAVPTLFVCEGLLVYLDEPTVVGLLTAAHRRAAPGSRLAASLTVHADGADRAEVTAAANARRRTGATEPWRTILTVTEHRALLRLGGWQVTDPMLAPSEHTVLITAEPVPLPD